METWGYPLFRYSMSIHFEEIENQLKMSHCLGHFLAFRMTELSFLNLLNCSIPVPYSLLTKINLCKNN